MLTVVQVTTVHKEEIFATEESLCLHVLNERGKIAQVTARADVMLEWQVRTLPLVHTSALASCSFDDLRVR